MDRISPGSHCALQRVAERRDGLNLDARTVFLNTLAATCNVTASAAAAKVTISACYWRRKRDPAFAQAWQEALTIGYERLEAALVAYALSRVEIVAIDPEAGDPAAIAASVVTALTNRNVSAADLNSAIGLLNRHQATVEGRATLRRGVRRATAAETDAAVRKKLDVLARQMAKHGR